MSYVDAFYDRNKNEVNIVERVNGERIIKKEKYEHVLYYEHPAGSYKSIFEDACRKFSTTDTKRYRRKLSELREKGTKIFESDIRETFRHLATHYMGAEPPVLNVGFFDIEADFDPERGWAPADDPFCAVTAITIHLSQNDKLVTLALIPKGITLSDAHALCDPVYENGELVRGFEDTILFENEEDMLESFLYLIENTDVLSGWHSEGYDVPYLVNRIKRVLGEDEARRLCLWNMLPREREYMKFGKMSKTYDLVGRVHLDYLVLYQKHVVQQQQSYKLDYIGEIEVGENKTAYDGTLDELYNNDFYKFIEYNRQDVMLLVKIDRKRRYIELHNQIAHANCVDLKTTVGSVALVETAIINEMHAMGFVVPNRKERDLAHPDDDAERTPVVGAYVAKPKVGIHYEVACIDINSLYPSAIRSLNMSPETIIGQVRSTETMALVAKRIEEGTPRAEAWEGIFCTLEFSHMMEEDDHIITVDFEDGKTVECTGKQLYEYVFNPTNNVCITANGTIFRTDKEGIIPQLLAKWYSERKQMQAKEADFAKIAEGIEISEELAALLR